MPKDYTVVNVEPPEMLAAIQRGNIDAFAVWEPWLSRTAAGGPRHEDRPRQRGHH